MCIVFLILCCGGRLAAQGDGRQVEILHADIFTSKKQGGKELRRLIGSVQLRQGDMTMFCDSAYFHSAENRVEAFGNVLIRQGDSLNISGNKLDYDGNAKVAVMYGKPVRMWDPGMTLTSDRLHYDAKTKIGSYTTGATILSGENTLTSQRGYYFSQSKMLAFRKNVVLTNPQYTMATDTLRYSTTAGVAYFFGPTNILAQNNKLYTENGSYNTRTEQARFGEKSWLRSDDQWLYGDSLYYDRRRGFGEARRNIRVIDTTQKLMVEGELARHNERTRQTMITHRVLATKGMGGDSVYLSADTLRVGYDTAARGKYRLLRGWKHCKIWNKSFQARCDSLYFSFADSVLDMRERPILWFDTYQATAARVKVFTHGGKLNNAKLLNDAFVIMPEEGTPYYSQVKGTDMAGYFNDNALFHIDVTGNSQAIYFVRDEKKAFIGMNSIKSSDIKIKLRDKKITRINFIKEPEAIMTPVKDFASADTRLPGFEWRGAERPLTLDSLRTGGAGINPLAPKPAKAPAKKGAAPVKKAPTKKAQPPAKPKKQPAAPPRTR